MISGLATLNWITTWGALPCKTISLVIEVSKYSLIFFLMGNNILPIIFHSPLSGLFLLQDLCYGSCLYVYRQLAYKIVGGVGSGWEGKDEEFYIWTSLMDLKKQADISRAFPGNLYKSLPLNYELKRLLQSLLSES